MIRLTCTSCKTVLTIDDAFAGGVCRCQHCGTIQTVPKRPKTGAPPAQRKLYGKPADPKTGSGLDDLANAVASSGLAEKMRSRSTGSSPKKAARWPLVVATAIAAGMVVAVVLVLRANREHDANPAAANDPAPAVNPAGVAPNSRDPSAPDPAPKNEPAFCGITLHSDSVIFVLDRGSASRDSFGYLKEATYKSLASLGPNRKFQVLLWKTADGSEDGYPLGSPIYATPKNIESCKKILDEVFAFGQTDAIAPLNKAAAATPGEIILVTGKGWELDDEFVKQAQTILGTTQIKLIAISIGSGDSAALKTLAEKFSGQYLTLSEGALRGFTD